MKFEPVATYRLQLTADFGFDAAAGQVDYLASLGVSHIYLSPVLQAAEGSLSGYDVVDPTHLSAELGGEEGFRQLLQGAKAAGLGVMVDIVPNHLAISDSRNPWWWEVLENGPASRYAPYFDVDWEASAQREANQVLLPVLGDHFGRELEAGKLAVRFEDGVVKIYYGDRSFPVDPATLPMVLERAANQVGDLRLGFISDAYARLPQPNVSAGEAAEKRHRDKAVLAKMLRELCAAAPAVERAIQDSIQRLNDDRSSLRRFIEAQNYRLAFWRLAEADLGYRRFFNINDLIGLRVELPEVFHETHQLPRQWIDSGEIQGLRVDHPDGLRDPAQYFQWLRESCPEAWIVVEKILEPGEELPDDWPVQGTTGYDFMNVVNRLFVDTQSESEFTRLYEECADNSASWDEVAASSKREALASLLGSDINRLAALLQTICYERPRHRDYTVSTLREAIIEVAASFPVYRAYVQADATKSELSEADERHVRDAMARAAKSNPEMDRELLELFRALLTGEDTGERESEFVMRFQQLTGPAMAKGLEDTAFYRYHRLISLNEVGGEPGTFGSETDAFHTFCARIAERWPGTLLASSTHDTKRSEDVRARLNALSEIPNEWATASRDWLQRGAGWPGAAELDRNLQYLFFQTIVGAWPIDVDRLLGFMRKAAREAKTHTTWTKPNDDYEQAMEAYVRAALGDNAFTDSVERFVERIQVAGWLNSLSQTLLKLTAPGVPDIYQGCELWDFSLVDPDNRRPVDFQLRQETLRKIQNLDADAVMARLSEGWPKLWLVQRVLAARRARAAPFSEGAAYRALRASGQGQNRLVAYSRGDDVVAVASRWFLGKNEGWGGTQIELPEGDWRNQLYSTSIANGSVLVEELLGPLPVALLLRENHV